MTNAAIIATECALRGINENVFTYAEWRARGRQVKRGEKARFSTTIHKPRTKKNDNGELEKSGGFFLKTAHFFTIDQTEPIKA